MKNFWLVLIMILILVVISFFVLSLVLANIHDVNMLEEWQRWIDKLKTTKETVEATSLIFIR